MSSADTSPGNFGNLAAGKIDNNEMPATIKNDCCDVFAAGDVDLRVLLHLTEPDLRELGYRSDTAKSSWRRLPMITPNARSERGSRP